MKMRVSRLAAIAAVSTSALVAACSSDSATAPTGQQTTTLSQALGELSLPALASAASYGAPVAVPALGTLASSGCTYSATSQGFTCPTVTSSGITFSESFTLLDASGAPQSQFDAKTTAAVRVRSNLSGTVAAGSAFTIDQQQDMTLSGLLAGPHVLNGTSTTHVAGSITSGTVKTPLTSTMTSTTTNLVLPASVTSGNAWPVSGSIAVDNTTSVASSPSITTHTLLTFNGTSTVAVVVSIGGISTHCNLDLSVGVPVCG